MQNSFCYKYACLVLLVLFVCFCPQMIYFLPCFWPQDPHGVAAAANASSGNVTSYDVIGVVGPVRSVDAIAASYLLSAVQMPVISFSATSDELSNKDLHPYFMRVVSPDEFQVKPHQFPPEWRRFKGSECGFRL